MTALALGARRGAAALALVVLLPALAQATVSASATEPSPVKAKGSLSVTPAAYMPGQAITFRGNIGKPGKRALHLQSNMLRPGDTWADVPGTAFQTDSNGNFAFTFPAPSMFDISYRAAGGGLVTPGLLLDVRPQEITLTLEGESADSPFYDVPLLLPFTVEADTTPAVRSTLGSPPAIPGRTVLLQQRVNGNRWQTIASKTTDSQGLATFDVDPPLLGGLMVLRARQERWTQGQNQIGWYGSFPAYFTAGPRAAARPGTGRASTGTARAAVAAKNAIRPTAAERYKWGPSRFDFAWERGQDLGSPPSKGTKLKGAWLDTSDGTGRVASAFNGSLVLQSKLKHGGAGDLGTTTATLTGNSLKRGRWEFRIQGHVWEKGARPYRFLLELVPAGAPVVECSPASVVVADFTMGVPGMRVGVRSKKAASVWTRREGTVSLGETPMNVAVEVGKSHITWYRDSKPFATLKDRKAQLGVRLVPRLSLIGQQSEMNGVQIDSDWQRAFSLKRGTQVKKGPKLARNTYSGAC